VIDVAVGVDIGTTYTKAVARTEDGTVIAVYRAPSPHLKTDDSTFLLDATKWWTCFKDVLRNLLTMQAPQHLHVVSICVSAIASTLTVFDSGQKDKAFAILYSSLAGLDSYDETSSSYSNSQLTERRLAMLRNAARKDCFVKPYISDLVGYINWHLSGTLTMNSISLAETGMLGGEGDCHKFTVADEIAPRLVAPSKQIGEIEVSSAKELGIEAGIPICGGLTDTMSSVVGAGLTRASEMMLYLGTFGSLMHLETDIDTLLHVPNCSSHPFRWLLSVPCFGPEIESLSHRWFGPTVGMDNFDREAMSALSGAGGTLFLVPRWKCGMNVVGEYQFMANRNGEVGNSQIQARAVLESLAYAVLALDVYSGGVIKVGGGGARSRIWIDALSDVLNGNIQAKHMTWEAMGTADIAGGLVWRSMISTRPYYTSQRHREVSQTLK